MLKLDCITTASGITILMVGGLFYLAALAVIARVRTNGEHPPEPAPGRVVLAH